MRSIWIMAAAAVLLVTLSFFFATPHLNPKSSDARFLLKGPTLFGASLGSAGEAAATRQSHRQRPDLAPAKGQAL